MANYSNESANNSCQRCQDGYQKVIYLTFDDGPEPGTIEIYTALKSASVPATFFFVGENVLATEDGTFQRKFPHWNLKPGLFKTVFDDPMFQIGNHSQTQSHQFYGSYYDTGLRIDPNTLKPAAESAEEGRRSVLVDFELSCMAFSYAMAGVPQEYWQELLKITDYGYNGEEVSKYFERATVNPYFRFLTARLPGTNRWRLPSKGGWGWDSGADRDDEADIMSSNKYIIYGWDLEWEFATSRQDNKSQMSVDVRQEHLDGNDGWWKYYDSNITEDRLKQSVDDMVKEVSSELNALFSKDMQAVILMHDRQFRTGSTENPTEYIDKLLEFITKCKDKGYTFDVLENYKA